MTFALVQHSTVIDFGHDTFGPAFTPARTHTDFLHGNLLFIGCSPPYQVVDFGWLAEGTVRQSIGTSVRFNLAVGCCPPYSFIDFGFVPQGSVSGARLDTHDGVKKKKKRKQVDLIAEEVERREKLRKQIEEVIHPTVIEVVPVEEKEEEVARSVVPVELKTLETPPVDYAGLARQQIIAKIQDDAQRELHRQLELKRQEDEEEERELMMILDSIL